MPREIKSLPAALLSGKSADGLHEIVFNEASHRYKLDGKACVGVTTFIKGGYPTSQGLISWQKGQALESLWNAVVNQEIDLATKDELFKAAKAADRAVSQEAADIGTLVHEYCYLNDTTGVPNELLETIGTLAVKDKILAGIEKYKAWKVQNEDVLIAAEQLIASPRHLFCGKFDRLGRRNKRLILSDYKTSKDIYLDQFIQLGAYSLALQEWTGLKADGLEVLRFGKDDEEFETLLIDDPNEILMFQAQAIRCRQTHEFRKLESDKRWKWEGAK